MSSGEDEFIRQRTAMPMFRPQCFDAQSTIRSSEQTADAIGNADSANTGSLRYSSPLPLAPRTLEEVRRALEKAGVEFIAENGGGPCVRLRKPERPRQTK